MTLWLKMLIGGGLGLLAGSLLGYFGKCSSGACPLTANPFRGAMIGVLVGVLIAMAWGRSEKSAGADNVPHVETTAEFDAKVLQADRPVLVDFYSDRCPPCRQLAPTISKLMTEYEGKAYVFKVDVDKVAELARRYGIDRIPTVMLFDGGEVVGQWISARDEQTYREALDSAAAKHERSFQ